MRLEVTVPFDHVKPMTPRRKGREKHISDDTASEVRSIKKPTQPNWEHQEVVSLVQAKKDEHIASLDVVDSRDYYSDTANAHT